MQVQDGNGTYYVQTDSLQAPRLLTNTSGQVVWQARYQAFGLATVNADVDGNTVAIELNTRFPGQYYDAESGLHYNYSRDYDPQTGRYVQADPIGIGGGLNFYAYVNSNPLAFVGPFWLAAHQACGAEEVRQPRKSRTAWLRQEAVEVEHSLLTLPNRELIASLSFDCTETLNQDCPKGY